MFGAIVAALLLTLTAAQPDTVAYGPLVVAGPGYVVVRGHGRVLLAGACQPSWCAGVHRHILPGQPVWVDIDHWQILTVTYCPTEDGC